MNTEDALPNGHQREECSNHWEGADSCCNSSLHTKARLWRLGSLTWKLNVHTWCRGNTYSPQDTSAVQQPMFTYLCPWDYKHHHTHLFTVLHASHHLLQYQHSKLVIFRHRALLMTWLRSATLLQSVFLWITRIQFWPLKNAAWEMTRVTPISQSTKSKKKKRYVCSTSRAILKISLKLEE